MDKDEKVLSELISGNQGELSAGLGESFSNLPSIDRDSEGIGSLTVQTHPGPVTTSTPIFWSRPVAHPCPTKHNLCGADPDHSTNENP